MANLSHSSGQRITVPDGAAAEYIDRGFVRGTAPAEPVRSPKPKKPSQRKPSPKGAADGVSTRADGDEGTQEAAS